MPATFAKILHDMAPFVLAMEQVNLKLAKQCVERSTLCMTISVSYYLSPDLQSAHGSTHTHLS